MKINNSAKSNLTPFCMTISESGKAKNDTMCQWLKQSLAKPDLGLDASLKKRVQLK